MKSGTQAYVENLVIHKLLGRLFQISVARYIFQWWIINDILLEIK